MCGIAGAIAPVGFLALEAISGMVGAISHRGPDDSGLEQLQINGSDIWLGSTRLAILDLSTAGHQPMRDPETGNWIVYNGEVYNFRELRRELQSLGCMFSSETDTEVVLKAYGAWGPASVPRLRGMFAFACWDASKQELFLCRDRLGEKPLYYYSSALSPFVFASEVRAILASGVVPRKLDSAGLEVFLTNGFLISPLTLVSCVRSLLPGHWMRVSARGEILQIAQYWCLPIACGSDKRPSELSEIRDQLRDAVRSRLISDVPLGAFLSGGMDSSAIVAFMRETGGETRTLSVAFEEKEFDESIYSRWVARRFHTTHTELKLTRSDFAQMFPRALSAMDQPTFDGVNTYCVSQMAKQAGLKVALSGTGSDEIFGGYDFFNWTRTIAGTRNLIALLPRPLWAFVRSMLSRNGLLATSGIRKLLEVVYHADSFRDRDEFTVTAYQTAQIQFPSWSRRLLRDDSNRQASELRSGLPDEFFQMILQEITGEPTSNAISKLALRVFLGERCLRDIDFMSMGSSLEVRAPFLDHIFVEELLRYSSDVRCSGAPHKPFLRQIVEPVLGGSYPWRKKQGFIFPFRDWLKDLKVADYLRQIVHDELLCQAAGLNPETVRALFHNYFEGRGEILWSRAWAIFALLSWCERNHITS